MAEPVDHELRTVQPYYDAVARGDKTFEIRRNDRNFKHGDTLWLREYCPKCDTYPGPSVHAEITYITDYQQQPGYVVLGIRLVREETDVDRVIWDWCDAAGVRDPDQVAMLCADVREAIQTEAAA